MLLIKWSRGLWLDSFLSDFPNKKYQPGKGNIHSRDSIHLPNQHGSQRDKFNTWGGARVSNESPQIALQSVALQTLCYVGIYRG